MFLEKYSSGLRTQARQKNRSHGCDVPGRKLWPQLIQVKGFQEAIPTETAHLGTPLHVCGFLHPSHINIGNHIALGKEA